MCVWGCDARFVFDIFRVLLVCDVLETQPNAYVCVWRFIEGVLMMNAQSAVDRCRLVNSFETGESIASEYVVSGLSMQFKPNYYKVCACSCICVAFVSYVDRFDHAN